MILLLVYNTQCICMHELLPIFLLGFLLHNRPPKIQALDHGVAWSPKFKFQKHLLDFALSEIEKKLTSRMVSNIHILKNVQLTIIAF